MINPADRKSEGRLFVTRAEISGLRRENEALREALALAGDYVEANQGGWCREGAGSNTVLRHIREALAGAAVQPSGVNHE